MAPEARQQAGQGAQSGRWGGAEHRRARDGERWRATLRCAGGEQGASKAFLFLFTKSSVASVNSESLVL